jgi:hypothetical protein
MIRNSENQTGGPPPLRPKTEGLAEKAQEMLRADTEFVSDS